MLEVVSFFINPLVGGIVTALGTAAEAGIEYEETGKVSIGTVISGAIGAVGFGALGVFGKTLSTIGQSLTIAGIMGASNIGSELSDKLQYGRNPSATQLGLD